MLTILKAAYPNFYRNMSPKDAMATLNLWEEMFAEDDVNIVKCSLKTLIGSHSGFPPDIAEVKRHMRMLLQTVTGEPTDEDLWRILRKAVCNGSYGAKEEFERLPPVLQRYCGSPSALRELAVQDEKTLDTVVHGQFLRQIAAIRERQQYHESLPDGVRDAVSRLYGRMDGDRVLTPAEENERRNAVLAALGGG
jgi:uncharacterized protein YcgL (UPF0745 family)